MIYFISLFMIIVLAAFYFVSFLFLHHNKQYLNIGIIKPLRNFDFHKVNHTFSHKIKYHFEKIERFSTNFIHRLKMRREQIQKKKYIYIKYLIR